MNEPDEAIPLLTEEIEVGVPPEAIPSPAPAPGAYSALPKYSAEETLPFPPLPPIDPEPLAVPPPPPALHDLDWETLTETVRHRVLGDVRAHLDRSLDAQLAQSITTAVERVVAEMGAELHLALHEVLREAVDVALTQQIAQLRGSTVGE